MSLKIPKSRKLGSARARSKIQEKERATKLGGRPVKGSGCGDEKGDARVEGILRLECKATKHKSFRVTMEMIEKIEEAAVSAGELPAIEVEFVDDQSRVLKRVAILPDYALETLLDQ